MFFFSVGKKVQPGDYTFSPLRMSGIDYSQSSPSSICPSNWNTHAQSHLITLTLSKEHSLYAWRLLMYLVSLQLSYNYILNSHLNSRWKDHWELSHWPLWSFTHVCPPLSRLYLPNTIYPFHHLLYPLTWALPFTHMCSVQFQCSGLCTYASRYA